MTSDTLPIVLWVTSNFYIHGQNGKVRPLPKET